MKMILRTLWAFFSFWAGGVIFFCVIPPAALPVLSFFFPTIVLPIFGGLSLIFAILGVIWQVSYWSNNITVSSNSCDAGLKLPIGIIKINNLGRTVCETLCKKLQESSQIEHIYTRNDWIDGCKIVVYYEDLQQHEKGLKIARSFRDAEKKKSISEQMRSRTK